MESIISADSPTASAGEANHVHDATCASISWEPHLTHPATTPTAAIPSITPARDFDGLGISALLVLQEDAHIS